MLGENYFPPVNNSHMSRRRGQGLNTIMNSILHYKPSVVYVCPTRGVNINLLPLLMMNNIKLRLVMPSKHFFTNLTEEEKINYFHDLKMEIILDAAASNADKIIILSQKKCHPLDWENHWYEASKRAVENSDWVIIVHDRERYNDAFDNLIMQFKENTKPVLAIGLGEEE